MMQFFRRMFNQRERRTHNAATTAADAADNTATTSAAAAAGASSMPSSPPRLPMSSLDPRETHHHDCIHGKIILGGEGEWQQEQRDRESVLRAFFRGGVLAKRDHADGKANAHVDVNVHANADNASTGSPALPAATAATGEVLRPTSNTSNHGNNNTNNTNNTNTNTNTTGKSGKSPSPRVRASTTLDNNTSNGNGNAAAAVSLVSPPTATDQEQEQEQVAVTSKPTVACVACMEVHASPAATTSMPCCKATMCRGCILRWARSLIKGTFGACPVMRCMCCHAAVPHAVWTEMLAPGADRDELLVQYRNNASGLLAIRCAHCDEQAEFILDDAFVAEPRDRKHASEMLLAEIADRAQRKEVAKKCKSFAKYKCNATELAVMLLQVASTQGVDMEDMDEQHEFLRRWLVLIVDLERRVSLHLAFFRAMRIVITECCHWSFCFRCSRDEHEDACEDLGEFHELRQCPGCGVAIQRAEGCDDITCLCGEVFQWPEATDAN